MVTARKGSRTTLLSCAASVSWLNFAAIDADVTSLHLVCFKCDIMFPSPTLAKADDGAMHGASILWHDHSGYIFAL